MSPAATDASTGAAADRRGADAEVALVGGMPLRVTRQIPVDEPSALAPAAARHSVNMSPRSTESDERSPASSASKRRRRLGLRTLGPAQQATPPSPTTATAESTRYRRPSEPTIERMQAQLAEARRAGRSYRRRVSWPPLAAGVLIGLIAAGLYAGTPAHSALWYIGGALASAVLPLLVLALPPTDAHAVRAVTWFVVVFLAVACGASAAAGLAHVQHDLGARACRGSLRFRLDAVALLYAAGACACGSCYLLGAVALRRGSVPTRRLLLRLWRVAGCVYAAHAAAGAYHLLATLALAPTPTRPEASLLPMGLFVAVTLGGAAFCVHPSVQLRVHNWLAARGEGVSAAAGIATLLGSTQDAQHAIATAESRFRCISADKLTPAVFERARQPTPRGAELPSAAAMLSLAGGGGGGGSASVAPVDNSWYELSEPAAIDGVDAFVSHS